MNKFELPYGVIETNSLGKLKSFLEKPSYNLFVNTGLYVFKKNILNYIPNNQEFDITKLISKLKKEKIYEDAIKVINQNSIVEGLIKIIILLCF